MKSCTGRGPRGWGWGGDPAAGTAAGGTDQRAWQSPRLAWASSATPCCLPSYEVQLESKVRRKGLGKFLIQILQLMANR